MGKLSDNADAVASSYFEDGESYQEIADRYGVSREAVRQLLNRRFPDRTPGRQFRQDRRASEREAEEAEEERRRIEEAPGCIICYQPVLRRTGGRGNNRTCSPEHSELWSQARYLLDEDLREGQRQSLARSIIKHRKTYKQSSITWAEKVINGEPVKTRTYVRKGSKARQAYEEVLRIRGGE